MISGLIFSVLVVGYSASLKLLYIIAETKTIYHSILNEILLLQMV